MIHEINQRIDPLGYGYIFSGPEDDEDHHAVKGQ